MARKHDSENDPHRCEYCGGSICPMMEEPEEAFRGECNDCGARVHETGYDRSTSAEYKWTPVPETILEQARRFADPMIWNYIDPTERKEWIENLAETINRAIRAQGKAAAAANRAERARLGIDSYLDRPIPPLSY